MFSEFEASSESWLKEMVERDWDKKAFTLNHGLYKLKRMEIGLKNAPMTVQRAMTVILASIRWQVGLVRLEDIFLFLNSP